MPPLMVRSGSGKTAPEPERQYDTLLWKTECTASKRSLLLEQPSGSHGAAWSEKRIPVDLDPYSHVALRAVSRPYHTLLFDSGLKDLVRHGIPASLRPTVWYWLSGGFALQLSLPEGHYDKLSTSTEGLDDETIAAIEDGADTICQKYNSQGLKENLVLTTGKGAGALRHVMYAVLQHCRDVRYSRALHQLAAFLVVVFGANHAEHVLWTLVSLIRTKMFPYAHGEVTHGNFIEKGVLELLVQRKLPKLSAHLAKKGIKLAAITHGWYSTLFTTNMHPEVAARMWDAMMTEGNKVMHRLALAMLKRCEPMLLGATDDETARRILELKLMDIADKDNLMESAFHGIGSMPTSLLDGLRKQVLRSPAFADFKSRREDDYAPPKRASIAGCRLAWA